MQVETYEEIEVDADGQEERDAEAIALIEQLGLEGQQRLLKKNEAGNTHRNVYPMMTSEQVFVFEQLFPQKTKVTDYAAGPIPVRVLQVVAHGREMFDRVEVWHKRVNDPDLKDPLLVGVNKEYSFETGYGRYLLARWGEALEPYPVLLELAAKRYRETLLSACRNAIALTESAPTSVLCSGSFENKLDIRLST